MTKAKRPRFPPRLPQHSTLGQDVLPSMTAGKFPHLLKLQGLQATNPWIPDLYKALVHAPAGTVPAVHVSHHPTSIKWKGEPTFFHLWAKLKQLLLWFPFQCVCIMLLQKHIRSTRHDVGAKWECVGKLEEFNKSMGRMKGFAKQ